ncbi:tRNA (adenosine(37)-N6)-threonylcarbamoyltransferase complex dimerization subunit type 1 TsaB [Vulcanococcus limneticus]|uniref:tRNA (adenosine(37)-N6)-threonylcarbamoyltransferase complex dimerization subunit type 1 TsaB n=1 Tax=Vulcanococcus limneticus TaxID=2170428 RepID=UPI00398BE9B4
MSASPWLLALHSSSETLAVGLQRLAVGAEREPAHLASFPLGRRLSNDLLPCVEQLLPAEQWSQLGRLVVATGPGGFTGTRLTLVLARTLAQQLAIPLHGFSSFLLIARRLAAPGGALAGAERFWLSQELPRRGVVAGAYGPDAAALGGVVELEEPRLYRPGEVLPEGPWAQALVEPEADAVQLLALGQLAALRQLPGPWQPVLPLYPTSPVEGP